MQDARHKTIENKMDTVECRELIVSTIRRRGKGIAGDPYRIVTEIFEKDGTKIAEHDPLINEQTFNFDMISFALWVKENDLDPREPGFDVRQIFKWRESVNQLTK
jgi:hypothetical protein